MKVLFVVADSVRPDFLGCYNPSRATPGIDALAAEGIRFETVYSAAPWTVPSIASMLTGRYSHRLGLVKWEQPYPAGMPTLFDHFGGAGSAVASFPFDPGHLFVHCPEARVVCSSQDTEAMLGWFRTRRTESWFAFVHHWHTHVPYLEKRLPLRAWNMMCSGLIRLLAEPDPERRAANRAKVIGLYEFAVQRFSDVWLLALMEAACPDLLILTADHGESWGERMAPGSYPRDVFDLHGNHLYNEVMRIPWILWGASVPHGRNVEGLARSVDMLPTILDLAGLPHTPNDLDGRSLAPFLEGGRIPPAQAVFSRNRDFVDQPVLPRNREDVFVEFGTVNMDTKILREVGGEARRYDLLADPGEMSPQSPTDADSPLLATLDRAWEVSVVGEHDVEDHARMRARLVALGYL